MPIPDADVRNWFDQNLVRFVENDVGAAIAGRANFGGALMLLCYTEVLGGVSTGLLGVSGNVRSNFNAGLRLLDAAALAEVPTLGGTYYSTFPIKLNGAPSSLYEVLRCGVVHEYFGKGLVPVANDPNDPTGASTHGALGVRWEAGNLLLDVNAYFKHFRAAVQILLAEVLADTASTGARGRFEKALATLSSRTLAP
jgi:hypothetical protein